MIVTRLAMEAFEIPNASRSLVNPSDLVLIACDRALLKNFAARGIVAT